MSCGAGEGRRERLVCKKPGGKEVGVGRCDSKDSPGGTSSSSKNYEKRGKKWLWPVPKVKRHWGAFPNKTLGEGTSADLGKRMIVLGELGGRAAQFLQGTDVLGIQHRSGVVKPAVQLEKSP